MINVLGVLTGILKQLHEDVIIDGTLFRLHNIITAVLLFGCSLIITSTQFVGSPIHCMVQYVPVKPVNTFCWTASTFSMPQSFNKQIGRQIPHPGVDTDYGAQGEKKYYTYYQWVCFALFFQGLACYAPKWIWDTWEGGLMSNLVMGMNHNMLMSDVKKKKKEALLIYLIDHIKRHRLYALRYWFCEFLCWANVLVQLYLMNRFFDGEFYDYGFRVLNMVVGKQENRVDPMAYIFPRVTKCTFHKFGPSGLIQRHDALCVLPLSIVNEKIYVIIWFWFTFLFIALTSLITYRLGLFIPSTRPTLLFVKCCEKSTRQAEIVTRNLDTGDWWVLYMLSKNLDPIMYNEIVVDLAKKFDDILNDIPTMKIKWYSTSQNE